MTGWTKDELTKIGRAEEIDIAARRPGGGLRNRVTIWAVAHGDALYIRSVRGRDGAWFRAVQETHEGRVWAGGMGKDVTFVEVDGDLEAEIDAAYRAKYRRYAGRILDSVLTSGARSTTFKVEPHSKAS